MSHKKFFNATLALLSLLNGYAFVFLRGFSLAMIITTVYALLGMASCVLENGKIKIWQLLLFWACGTAQTMLTIVFRDNADYSRVFYIILKVFAWAAFITFCGRWFDYRLFLVYMKNVVAVTFVYLVIQYIIHFIFNKSIPCAFDFGIIKANSTDYEYIISSSSDVFRPGSFWLEPAFLGYYYNLFLMLCLLDRKQTSTIIKHVRLYTIIACIGIVLSASTGAIGIMIIVYLIKLTIKDKRQAIVSIFLVLLVVLLVRTAIENNWIEMFKGYNPSIDSSIWKLQNLDENSRVGKSYEMLNALTSTEKIFGIGMGNEIEITEGEYLNGIATIICWLGYSGLSGWLLIFLNMGRIYCKSIVSKSIVYILFFQGFFAGIYFGTPAIIYLMVALYKTTSQGETRDINNPQVRSNESVSVEPQSV